MTKKILTLMVVSIIMISCGTTKKATTEATSEAVVDVQKEEVIELVPPVGVEFVQVQNYQTISKINMPVSGNGFSRVDDTKENDGGESFPVAKFGRVLMSIKAEIYDAKGGIDVQYEKLKEKVLKYELKENSEIHFEKTEIGQHEAALVEIVTKLKTGAVIWNYGYIVQNGDIASSFMFQHMNINPSNLESSRTALDEALRYMVGTLEFK